MKLGFALVVSGFLASCVSMDFTTARSVSVKPGKGGVVTLNPPQDPKARDKAQAIMNQTCAKKKVEITEEGEVTVGTSTTGNTSYDSGSRGQVRNGITWGGSSPSAATNSEQKNLTEWRITYECK